MHSFSRLPAAAGARAHPARQDLREPADDSGQAAGPRRPAVRWRARTAVAVTAIAVPLLAGAAPALAAGGPAAAAASTGHIYWGENSSSATGTVGRATVDGTKVNQSFIPGPAGATGAAHVYWTNGTGQIGRASLDGTGGDQNFITGARSPFGVAAAGAHVYWANLGTMPSSLPVTGSAAGR